MSKVEILTDVCKGCGLCVSVCPKGIMSLSTDVINAKGYAPVTITAMQECIGCAACAKVCPDAVLSVFKEVQA
ncbi:MAG: 4Fe-4S binding protein [Eubacteriales bacterium]